MIALDSSALVAIAIDEPDAKLFAKAVSNNRCIIGTPTLVEVHMVLRDRAGDIGVQFVEALLKRRNLTRMDFTEAHFRLAAAAFDRYGRGRHPASSTSATAWPTPSRRRMGCRCCIRATTSPAPTSPPLSHDPSLQGFRRIVLKVGSSLLVDRGAGRLNHAWLAALAEDIAELHARGARRAGRLLRRDRARPHGARACRAAR